jgi:hypothetical protein
MSNPSGKDTDGLLDPDIDPMQERAEQQRVKPQYGSDRPARSLSPERKDPFASGSDTGGSSYKTLIGKHSQAREDKQKEWEEKQEKELNINQPVLVCLLWFNCNVGDSIGSY